MTEILNCEYYTTSKSDYRIGVDPTKGDIYVTKYFWIVDHNLTPNGTKSIIKREFTQIYQGIYKAIQKINLESMRDKYLEFFKDMKLNSKTKEDINEFMDDLIDAYITQETVKLNELLEEAKGDERTKEQIQNEFDKRFCRGQYANQKTHLLFLTTHDKEGDQWKPRNPDIVSAQARGDH
tara:strand:+ start:14 stop:553 length:540 start_codon:yes stop_codon:yes gene_type:complete